LSHSLRYGLLPFACVAGFGRFANRPYNHNQGGCATRKLKIKKVKGKSEDWIPFLACERMTFLEGNDKNRGETPMLPMELD
jgi:hypothetical protein